MECRKIRINQLKQRNRELNVHRITFDMIGDSEEANNMIEEIKLNEEIIKFLER